ncbi:transmembrane protein 127-like [Schistocerca serialis cubense]|uniref:transmembrane protein 127-like n=1 Tax=Schistocerca serialis cubense TaxID=2023355 RepID=UPI00214F505F|nr:transmembrane protein 127-like [Schistocerca serialis cubense]
MHNQNCFPRQRWSLPKDQERNFVAAFFHMATIALTCTSLAQLGWFRIRGSICSPHLAVYQFFSADYPTETERDYTFSEFSPPVTIQYYPQKETPRCMNQEIANLMRTVILLCFMAMSSSLLGFFLDIIGPTTKILRTIRRNAIPSIFTVICVVAIIGLCYYITTLLQRVIQNSNPEREVKVAYEYGCYTITAAGVVAVFATASNLLQYYSPNEDAERQRIFGDWDGLETFSVGGWGRGTPLESIPPPPPYSP